jgi:hypothetical protein
LHGTKGFVLVNDISTVTTDDISSLQLGRTLTGQTPGDRRDRGTLQPPMAAEPATSSPADIDWVRSAGLISGVALGLALEVLDPPLAVLMLAAPVARRLAASETAPRPLRVAGRLIDGLSAPLRA